MGWDWCDVSPGVPPSEGCSVLLKPGVCRLIAGVCWSGNESGWERGDG